MDLGVLQACMRAWRTQSQCRDFCRRAQRKTKGFVVGFQTVRTRVGEHTLTWHGGRSFQKVEVKASHKLEEIHIGNNWSKSLISFYFLYEHRVSLCSSCDHTYLYWVLPVGVPSVEYSRWLFPTSHNPLTKLSSQSRHILHMLSPRIAALEKLRSTIAFMFLASVSANAHSIFWTIWRPISSS